MYGILGTGDVNTISGLLEAAGSMVTWFITQMGAYLNFITSNPLILSMFLIMLAGAGIGFLFRIWHSV